MSKSVQKLKAPSEITSEMTYCLASQNRCDNVWGCCGRCPNFLTKLCTGDPCKDNWQCCEYLCEYSDIEQYKLPKIKAAPEKASESLKQKSARHNQKREREMHEAEEILKQITKK